MQRSDAELRRWCQSAYRLAMSRSEVLSPYLWRSCLRALEAPFASETTVMRAYGCTWAEIRAALESDTWPPIANSAKRVRMAQLSANVTTEVPHGEMDGDECWAALVGAAKARATAAEELQHREIRITGSEPIGIVVMGDMHVGSVGVDYARLEGVVKALESTERLFAVSIGDILDSMIWRTVMHEGRKSPVDFPGEVRAAARFLQRLNADGKLIGVCAGNHDLISGKLTGLAALDTVMETVCRDVPYHPYQLDLTVVLEGDVEYRVRLRHKVTGNSGWNPAHGVGKAHRFDDGDADVICAGHTHRSGVAELRHKGRMRYGVQVGAYKVAALDDYALENGFTNENNHPDYMVLLWPKNRRIEVLPTATGLDLLRTFTPSANTRRATPTPTTRATGTARASSKSTSKTARRSSHAAKPRRT